MEDKGHFLREHGYRVGLAQDGEAYTLCCRPVALQRAMSNVPNNAVKYGGCALFRLEVEEGSCAIQVGDGGPWVPEDRLETTFEPFVRLAPARSRSTGAGTSLPAASPDSGGYRFSACLAVQHLSQGRG